jgi:hypothetical protein
MPIEDALQAIRPLVPVENEQYLKALDSLIFAFLKPRARVMAT